MRTMRVTNQSRRPTAPAVHPSWSTAATTVPPRQARRTGKRGSLGEFWALVDADD